ncbi:MAG: SUMF1/EgtB/PvdO family nonheme iron enzyme [Hyphomonas sp.]|uniref:formylglycine-generating enzyme family protein n=1 Tax=Hyphomonas sp. TaxID=87 RepID=UPI0032992484
MTNEIEVVINPALRKALEAEFSATKYHATAGACLQYAGARKVDAVYCDIWLPTADVLDDKTLTKQLRNDFKAFSGTDQTHLQGVTQIGSNELRSEGGKAPVLAVVACPENIHSSHIDQWDFEQKKSLFLNMLSGLAALHAAGLTHGNLSLGALRRETPKGATKLCDVSFSAGGARQVFMEPSVLMSAQRLDDGTHGIADDLYAAGMLGYRIFSGENGPWKALTGAPEPLTEQQLWQAIKNGPQAWPDAAGICPDDPDAAKFIAPALARMTGQSDTGFSDASAVLLALNDPGVRAPEAAAPARPRAPDTQTTTPDPVPTPQTTTKNPRGLVYAGVGALVLVAGGLTANYFWQQAELDQTVSNCTLDTQVPDALGPLVAFYNDNLLQARNDNDAAALEKACVSEETLLEQVGIWQRARTLLDRSTALTSLVADKALATDAEPVKEAAKILSEMMNPQTPDEITALYRAIEPVELTTNALFSDIRGDVNTLIETFGNQLTQLGATDALKEASGAVASAQTADDIATALSQAEETDAAVRSETGQAWQAIAEQAGAAAVQEIDSLPAPQTATTQATQEVAQSLEATKLLTGSMTRDAASLIARRDENAARIDAALSAVRAAALKDRREAAAADLALASAATLPDKERVALLLADFGALEEAHHATPDLTSVFEKLGALSVAAQKIVGDARAAAEAEKSTFDEMMVTAKTAGIAQTGPLNDVIDAANSASKKGGWTIAMTGWEKATEALRGAVSTLRTNALAAQSAAQEARSAAEGLETLDADTAFETAGTDLKAEKFAAAKAGFDKATNQYNTAIGLSQSAPKPFTVGLDDKELQALQAICSDASLVAAACFGDSFPAPDRRTVELSPFSLDAAEVTVSEFETFTRATGYRTTAEQTGQASIVFTTGTDAVFEFSWRAPDGPATRARGDDPVSVLSAQDAAAYCTHHGKRLPAAEEFEAVSRAGDGRIFVWGSDWQPTAAVWQGSTAARQPAASAGGVAASGETGLAGNVREWVTTADGYAVAGGSWLSVSAVDLAAAAIRPTAPGVSGVDFGVRCVKDLEKWP